MQRREEQRERQRQAEARRAGNRRRRRRRGESVNVSSSLPSAVPALPLCSAASGSDFPSPLSLRVSVLLSCCVRRRVASSAARLASLCSASHASLCSQARGAELPAAAVSRIDRTASSARHTLACRSHTEHTHDSAGERHTMDKTEEQCHSDCGRRAVQPRNTAERTAGEAEETVPGCDVGRHSAEHAPTPHWPLFPRPSDPPLTSADCKREDLPLVDGVHGWHDCLLHCR